MSEQVSRDMAIPKQGATAAPQPVEPVVVEQEQKAAAETVDESKKEIITEEEADLREKVFFETDEKVQLRDGRTYYMPPLGLKDARKLMKKLNTIDSGVIISNLIPEDDAEDDRYDELLEVILIGFKPYYKDMTTDYLEDYVDLESAKKIIDCMIGLNGLKKSL